MGHSTNQSFASGANVTSRTPSTSVRVRWTRSLGSARESKPVDNSRVSVSTSPTNSAPQPDAHASAIRTITESSRWSVGVGVDHHLAARRPPPGVSSRRGRVEALGPGVDLHRLVEAGAGLEDGGGVEGGFGTAATDDDPARCSGRGCRCADAAMARTMRAVMASASMRSLEWTLATTTSSRASMSSSMSRSPSARMSTSMPVRTRNGASSSLSAGDDVELGPEPVDRQAVGDGQAGRMVGEHDVARGRGHGRPWP